MKEKERGTAGIQRKNLRRLRHQMNISAQVFQPPSKSVLPPSLHARSDDVIRSFMIFVRLSHSDVCALLFLFSVGPGAEPSTHPLAPPHLNPPMSRPFVRHCQGSAKLLRVSNAIYRIFSEVLIKEYCILGRDVVSSGRFLSTFRANILASPKNKSSKITRIP